MNRSSVRLLLGDCRETLLRLPDASVDAVVTDPPYSLEFMGKSWDAHSAFDDDPAFGYYLAGLVDGEGCFRVQRHERGTHTCTFALKLRADDEAILHRAQRYTGAGQVEHLNAPSQSSSQVRWVVQDKAGCQRLVDLFDKYPLRAKKSLDFQLWRDAVCEWTDRPRGNRWAGPADQARAAAIKSQIENVRHYVDPPWSGNGFQDWSRMWATECLRVLKPGGHLLAFGGTRTYHRLACAIEDAGFEIRDSIHWIYGSGFPKSLDVSKAIDKAAGAEREVVGERRKLQSYGSNADGAVNEVFGGGPDKGGVQQITAPATPDAARWSGWGTALKPAHEPIIVARKPLASTVAANVRAHGTGALNIDGCRVETTDNLSGGAYSTGSRGADLPGADRGTAAAGMFAADGGRLPGQYVQPQGRWPANIVLTHAPDCAEACDPACPVAEMDAQSGISAPKAGRVGRKGGCGDNGTIRGLGDPEAIGTWPADPGGGASRFFPVFRYCAKAPTRERPVGPDGTKHPTVKPLDLMRWLVRLVTPPGGVVLEPFAGSGTTVEACVLECFDVIACELNQEYVPLIRTRVERARAQIGCST